MFAAFTVFAAFTAFVAFLLLLLLTAVLYTYYCFCFFPAFAALILLLLLSVIPDFIHIELFRHPTSWLQLDLIIKIVKFNPITARVESWHRPMGSFYPQGSFWHVSIGQYLHVHCLSFACILPTVGVFILMLHVVGTLGFKLDGEWPKSLCARF